MERRFIVFMLLGICISITACSSVFTTKINDILSNPRDYTDKQVTVSGEVEDAFSLIVVKYFVLKDDTGTIPVISQKPMPAKGKQIKVTGIVQEAFSLGDQNLVVIIEK